MEISYKLLTMNFSYFFTLIRYLANFSNTMLISSEILNTTNYYLDA